MSRNLLSHKLRSQIRLPPKTHFSCLRALWNFCMSLACCRVAIKKSAAVDLRSFTCVLPCFVHYKCGVCVYFGLDIISCTSIHIQNCVYSRLNLVLFFHCDSLSPKFRRCCLSSSRSSYISLHGMIPCLIRFPLFLFFVVSSFLLRVLEVYMCRSFLFTLFLNVRP